MSDECDGDEWEALCREVAARYLTTKLDALSLATDTLDRRLRDGGDLTRGDIGRFRNALADLQTIVEQDLTAVAEDGVDPYDGALDHIENRVFVEHAGGLEDFNE